MKINNPYIDIRNKVRHTAISHEHIPDQRRLEESINRGVDVLCASHYFPCVPYMPIDGFTREYIDWEFVLDNDGNIVYELDDGGNIKTKTVKGVSYKIPRLNRVTKSYSNGFQDFEKEDGTMSDLANLVQLPNCEHAFFSLKDGSVDPSLHLNYVGSFWGDAVNAPLENLDKYNGDEYSLTSGGFRAIFPLWTLEEEIYNAKSNLMFEGKCFGTINHPGWSSLSFNKFKEVIETGKGLFKAIEIFNRGDTDSMATYNHTFYDNLLLRGYKLWALVVKDWGGSSIIHGITYPSNFGSNLLYLDASYESKTVNEKAEMALDAYIAGSFAGIGLGTIDIEDVVVSGNTVNVTFNKVPDRIVVDVDGSRREVTPSNSVSASLGMKNKFVRFEAYKDNDFVYTQPFFVEDAIDFIKIAAVLGD